MSEELNKEPSADSHEVEHPPFKRDVHETSPEKSTSVSPDKDSAAPVADADTSSSLSPSTYINEKLNKLRSELIRTKSLVSGQRDEIEDLKRQIAQLKSEKSYMQQQMQETDDRCLRTADRCEQLRKEAGEAKMQVVTLTAQRDELEAKMNEAWKRVAELLDEKARQEAARNKVEVEMQKLAADHSFSAQQQEALRRELQATAQQARSLTQEQDRLDQSTVHLYRALGTAVRVIVSTVEHVTSTYLRAADAAARAPAAAELEELEHQIDDCLQAPGSGAGEQEEEDDDQARMAASARVLLGPVARSIQSFCVVLQRLQEETAAKEAVIGELRAALDAADGEKDRVKEEAQKVINERNMSENIAAALEDVLRQKTALEQELQAAQETIHAQEAELSTHTAAAAPADTSTSSQLHAAGVQKQYEKAIRYIEQELEPLTESQAKELVVAHATIADLEGRLARLQGAQGDARDAAAEATSMKEVFLVLTRAYTGVCKDFGEVLQQRKALHLHLRAYERLHGPWEAPRTIRRAVRTFRVVVVAVLAALRLQRLQRDERLRECLWTQRLPITGCPALRHRLRLPTETRLYVEGGLVRPSPQLTEGDYAILAKERLNLPPLFADPPGREEGALPGLATYIGMMEDLVTVKRSYAGPTPPPPLSALLQERLKHLLYDQRPLGSSRGSSRSRSVATPRQQQQPSPAYAASRGAPPPPRGAALVHPLHHRTDDKQPEPRSVPYPSFVSAPPPSAGGHEQSVLNSSSIAARSADTSVQQNTPTVEQYLEESILQDQLAMHRLESPTSNLFASEVLGVIEALERRVTGALQRSVRH